MTSTNRYSKLLEAIFFAHFRKSVAEFEFQREEIEQHAATLGIKLPKNLGDLIYSFRYRTPLPERIRNCAPAGKEWVIEPAGRSRYRFRAAEAGVNILPNALLREIKVPDATPGLISMYALSDEQALLAKIRYNRLVDLFSRLTCYSLQNHLRTFVPKVGQVETDELYVGVDREGSQYILPVQAKGGKDRLSAVQIRQDLAVCSHKFRALICRPIGAQFMSDSAIALFEFEDGADGIRILSEKHYRLVPPEEISPEDLKRYRSLSSE
ncbi:MAG: endonuclease [Candidatus Sumerlaeota bacterium]|nr:endonuclease [Candidatus Sumerlaeota bacterium]